MSYWTAALVASLGSFLFGFDTAVISGTTAGLSARFALTDATLGFTVASALFGTMLGALGVGRPVERLGRRPLLLLTATLYLVSALGCSLAWDWYSLLGFRFIGGVGVGAASVVAPMYISETAPARRRGLLVTVAQLNIVLGILFAYVSNFLVVRWLVQGEAAWRWMFGVEAAPALLFLVFAALIPESPRWLAAHGREDGALTALRNLGHGEPEAELGEIRTSIRKARAEKRESLFHRAYRKPLLLAGMIAAFNQLDGINAILYYAADLFALAGYESVDALGQSMAIGLVNLVMTFVGMALIDRAGRKTLLLVGSVTFVLFHTLAAWVFFTGATGPVVLIALGGIVGSHAYSQGAVVWAVINELLPNAIRSSAASGAIFVMWALAAAISWIFPAAARSFGAWVFGFFALMMVLQFVLVLGFLPETKGRSLEEIERGWAADPSAAPANRRA